jgi:hypothetical protein
VRRRFSFVDEGGTVRRLAVHGRSSPCGLSGKCLDSGLAHGGSRRGVHGPATRVGAGHGRSGGAA